MTDETALDRLAGHFGIGRHFRDAYGFSRDVSAETKRGLLSAMGLPVGDAAAIAESLRQVEADPWQSPVPPVIVAIQDEPFPPIPIVLGADRSDTNISWQVAEETGQVHRGSVRPADLPIAETRTVEGRAMERRHFVLRLALPVGYHRLRLDGPAVGPDGSATLIVAPPHCFMPEALRDDGQVWGVTVQLYGLRSERNWGIGDFTDLRRLVEGLAPLGIDVVGVNPLHALFIDNPDHASPYSPASRLFLNVLYIDVEAIPDLADCRSARALIDGMRADGRLDRIRDSLLVDYAGVSAAKRPVFEALYASFRMTHLASGQTERARAFRAFQEQGGNALQTFALFEALSEHFRQRGSGGHGWTAWPAAYQDLASPEVSAFVSTHRERIEFFQYLQWQAELQLQAAADACVRSGMRIGLYRDLALGVDSGGADVWFGQSFFAAGVSIGAPPDPFNAKGQNWGLPPMIPRALRDSAYEPLIEVLRANMRHNGALRIDHVLGFMRLFWIPWGATPADGAYVDYPLDDLLSIVALESHRNRCLVVGEDLGTVPEGFVDRIRSRGILSYRLLYFEQGEDGAFRPPQSYPQLCLVAVTTHDLPTLPGYWGGHDIDLRQSLDLFPSGAAQRDARRTRDRDRRRLLEALREEDLLPADEVQEAASAGPPSDRLVRSIYRYLARTPAKLLIVALEDVLGEEEQANLPGTTDQHPNWRRKLSLEVDRLATDPRIRALAQALGEVRPAQRPGRGAP